MTLRAATIPLLGALLLGGALPATAQEAVRREIRDSQLRLEQIRKEREDLQREMATLRSRVHDASGQLANIERRISTSAEALKEIEFQSEALAASVEQTTRELLQSRDRLRARKVVLANRLRGIYKRGRLHAAEVLLGAESFGDLINRYRYLHLIALSDRKLIDAVGRLERRLVEQEQELTQSLAVLQEIRQEKVDEMSVLRTLEDEQQTALRGFRQRERRAQGRLQQLAKDEARLTDMIAELERKRLEEERRRVVAGGRPAAAASLTTRSLGALDWPVEGELVYRFGPERRSNGVVLRWNGIGIAARPGTPVRAVEAGTVVMAGAFEGYGPSVMISHGGGYYTLYLYLDSVGVRSGQQITARQVIGTVGGEQTPEGAHIEFQVRAPTRSGGSPEPVDPLSWLRRKAGR